MNVPNMCRLIFCCFWGFLFISRLEAKSFAGDVDIPNVPKLNPLNFSEFTVKNELYTFYDVSRAFNSTDKIQIDHRKMVKRETVDYANENVTFQIELGLYGYCKVFLFVIIRIFFGIVMDVSKVKDVIFRPIGPTIAIFCNFVFLPLVSHNFLSRRSISKCQLKRFLIGNHLKMCE